MSDRASQLKLRTFAIRHAGPREALIVVIVNVSIAIYFYGSASSLCWSKAPSVISMIGPMSFVLTQLTTYFGVLSARLARGSGRVAPDWPASARWQFWALRLGFVRGIATCSTMVILLYLIGFLCPDQRIPKIHFFVIVGLIAAALGYSWHVSAILMTSHRFPPTCDRANLAEATLDESLGSPNGRT